MSTGLHSLIHSLSKSEKSYFKKFTSIHSFQKDNNYIKLFGVIENQKIYDENKIKTKFKNEKFITQLNVTKNYLFRQILKSMRNYSSEISFNTKTKSHITDIYFLMGKRLYSEAYKELGKIKITAYKHGKHIDILEILDLEKYLIRRLNLKNQTEILNKLYNEDISVINLIRTEKSLAWLYRKLVTLRTHENIVGKYSRNFYKLKDIIKEAGLLYKNNPITVKSEILYNQIQVAYFFSVPDDKNAYTYSKKLIYLIETNPTQLDEEPMSYISSILNLMELNLNMRLYWEFEENAFKLESLLFRLKKRLTESNKLFIKTCILNERITYYNKTGKYIKSIELIENSKVFLKNDENKIDIIHKAMLYLNIAIAYFNFKSYNVALGWVNKILNDNELKTAKNYFNSAMYLSFFIHFEIGNYDLLEYIIKSVYRNKDEKYDIEKVILSYLNQLIDAKIGEKKYIYSKFKNNIIGFYKLAGLDRNKISFDIINWIESKLLLLE